MTDQPVPEFDIALEWLPISDLVIDPAYQRTLKPYKVKDIIDKFNIKAFSVLDVSMRNDGTLVLLEGQHRRAAMIEMGLQDWKVPCAVHFELTPEEEACIFGIINNGRTRLTNLESFRAAVVEKDPTALKIQEILESLGLFAAPGGNRPGIFRAVGAAERVVREVGPERLKQTLHLLIQTWPGQSQGLHNEMVLGLALVLGEYGEDLKLDRLVSCLSADRPERLLSDARMVKASLGGELSTCIAHQIVHRYNKGTRSSRVYDWTDRPFRRSPLVGRGA